MAKVGVVLSGCGVFDGAEIHEAVLTLLALDRRGAEAVCMAPNVDQAHVVDHLTGQPVGGSAATCSWKRRGSPGARSGTWPRSRPPNWTP